MFYSEVNENGYITRSQFTTDPSTPVQEHHRLVEDDSTRPEGFNRLTQKYTRIEPVTGNKVEYIVETKEYFIQLFTNSDSPAPVDIEDYKKMTPVNVSFPNLKIVCINLDNPIKWKYRPFNRSNYFHRQVVVGGTVNISFTNNALPTQIMSPGEVWPLDIEYTGVDEFITTGSNIGTKVYCIFADENNRIVEDTNGPITIGGIKFRQEFVI